MPTFRELQFIGENPSIAAFDLAQKNAQQRLLSDEELQNKRLQNKLDAGGLSSRLRQIEANADTAVARAGVDVASVPFDIASREAKARSSTSRANVDEATEPYAIDTQRSGARLANVRADIAEETKGDTVSATHSLSRSRAARASEDELGTFYKVLDLLNQGDVVSAKEVARRTGQDLPDEAINDSQWRLTLTQIASRAKELYPHRPRDQQSYIGAQVDTLRKLQEAGQRIDVSQRYAMPAGAPQPPELALGDKGQSQPADIRTAEWLVANKVAANAAEAWEMVRRSRSNPAATRAQVFNAALRSNFGDQAKAQRIADEFMRSIEPPSPAVTRPAPSAPAPRGGVQDPRRPLDIQIPQRPASVPPGSAYSPSRGMWRSPDGRVFDQNGNPVTQ